ncbi:uncharacterized protein G2W53_026638 [Senna tora]|uniref:Uncharacterized protein n=1 Tax=Senna tora TaxID=362788 RepID=A0A834TFE9_9FABA|nr:uncharacterized protein G2W53_026638 [Senna tora]
MSAAPFGLAVGCFVRAFGWLSVVLMGGVSVLSIGAPEPLPILVLPRTGQLYTCNSIFPSRLKFSESCSRGEAQSAENLATSYPILTPEYKITLEFGRDSQAQDKKINKILLLRSSGWIENEITCDGLRRGLAAVSTPFDDSGELSDGERQPPMQAFSERFKNEQEGPMYFLGQKLQIRGKAEISF